MITKRGFLMGLICAPAIVRSASLMPVYVPPLILYGRSGYDDTEALQAWADGKRRVLWGDGRVVGRCITGYTFQIGAKGVPLYIRGDNQVMLMNCIFAIAYENQSRPVRPWGALVGPNVVLTGAQNPSSKKLPAV